MWQKTFPHIHCFHFGKGQVAVLSQLPLFLVNSLEKFLALVNSSNRVWLATGKYLTKILIFQAIS